MSANHWAVCPRCTEKRDESFGKAHENLNKLYGKITPEQYRKQFDDIIKLQAEPLEESFREDWGIGMKLDYEFSVSYGGECKVCGLKFEFKHTVDIRTGEVK